MIAKTNQIFIFIFRILKTNVLGTFLFKSLLNDYQFDTKQKLRLKIIVIVLAIIAFILLTIKITRMSLGKGYD